MDYTHILYKLCTDIILNVFIFRASMISLNEQRISENFKSNGKFVDLTTTAKNEARAFVELQQLNTLWFNTGTLCNLTCKNCYIESSPTNDELIFITEEEVKVYLDEIDDLNLDTEKIAFTGGEPFLNKEIIPILELSLSRGFEVLVLTNAYRAIDRYFEMLINLNKSFPRKLKLRVSLDHYTAEEHEKERGAKTFDRTLITIQKLVNWGFEISIAGRSLKHEPLLEALEGYQKLLENSKIPLKVEPEKNIVIFPEMSPEKDVPEITTACWDILNTSPHVQMCANERMVVRRKNSTRPVVLPCTLITYDQDFELGSTLKESFKKVYLNHPYCAQFCVLGGASCSV